MNTAIHRSIRSLVGGLCLAMALGSPATAAAEWGRKQVRRPKITRTFSVRLSVHRAAGSHLGRARVQPAPMHGTPTAAQRKHMAKHGYRWGDNGWFKPTRSTKPGDPLIQPVAPTPAKPARVQPAPTGSTPTAAQRKHMAKYGYRWGDHGWFKPTRSTKPGDPLIQPVAGF